jgi:DNA-binding PadR family transcriptional regulator
MESSSKEPQSFLPLTPIVFHILLTLSSQDRHGYGIIKEVEARTEGRVRIQTGTLYQAIKRLLGAGLISEVESKVDPELDDERRRYYALTGLGIKVLNEEALRLERLVNLARANQVLGSQISGSIMGEG